MSGITPITYSGFNERPQPPKLKAVYKFPMQQMILTIDGLIWRYIFVDGKIQWHCVGSTFEVQIKDPYKEAYIEFIKESAKEMLGDTQIELKSANGRMVDMKKVFKKMLKYLK